MLQMIGWPYLYRIIAMGMYLALVTQLSLGATASGQVNQLQLATIHWEIVD